MIEGSDLRFIEESNRIEGILRDSTEAEIEEYKRFMAQDEITVQELRKFVSVYQPNAVLRDKTGLNVRVGGHIPIAGGSTVLRRLVGLLEDANKFDEYSAFEIHQEYETLHPFTDCNGRSGRMLWKWMMKKQGESTRLGFLHTWYYQSLSGAR